MIEPKAIPFRDISLFHVRVPGIEQQQFLQNLTINLVGSVDGQEIKYVKNAFAIMLDV